MIRGAIGFIFGTLYWLVIAGVLLGAAAYFAPLAAGLMVLVGFAFWLRSTKRGLHDLLGNLRMDGGFSYMVDELPTDNRLRGGAGLRGLQRRILFQLHQRADGGRDLRADGGVRSEPLRLPLGGRDIQTASVVVVSPREQEGWGATGPD